MVGGRNRSAADLNLVTARLLLNQSIDRCLSRSSSNGVAVSLHIKNRANNPPKVRRVAYAAARHLRSLRAALMPAAIRPGTREHAQAIRTLSLTHLSFSPAQNATT